MTLTWATQKCAHTGEAAGCADHEHVAREKDGARDVQDLLGNAHHRSRRRPLRFHSALSGVRAQARTRRRPRRRRSQCSEGVCDAFGTTWKAMQGRGIRTSCCNKRNGSTLAAALLEQTGVSSVGGVELHRSNRRAPGIVASNRNPLLTAEHSKVLAPLHKAG